MLAARAERARVARTFVDGVLGPRHPCGDVAACRTAELSTAGQVIPESGQLINVLSSIRLTRPRDTGTQRIFHIFNDHPTDAAGAELACAYYGRRLRSLSVGDVVAVGEVILAVGRPAGWDPVCGGLAEVRADEHGTPPLPAHNPVPGGL